ncbi:MAG: BON domain-containing protein [Flavisolibacter sp.]
MTDQNRNRRRSSYRYDERRDWAGNPYNSENNYRQSQGYGNIGNREDAFDYDRRYGNANYNQDYRGEDYNRYTGSNYENTSRSNDIYGGNYEGQNRNEDYYGGYSSNYGRNYDNINRDRNDSYDNNRWRNTQGWSSEDTGNRNYGLNRESDYGANYGEERKTRNRYGGDTSNYGNANQGGYDRGWWDRTRDEVSSWFGDDDAERRRRMDKATGPHKGKGPKGYHRSDERIREDVCDRLCDNSMIDASDIDIKVEGSEVILTGTVESKEDKRRAEDIAESISGVSNVQNQLRVEHSGRSSSDERIR